MSVLSLFVVKKEVQKKDAEKQIESTGKKRTTKRKWKETV